MEIVILGSGTSGCVPSINCLIEPIIECKVCLSAIQHQPKIQPDPLAPTIYSKNRRRNTSALIRIPNEDGRTRNIVIDCGKTFYESTLTWFVEYRFRRIDAVILTHGHADAILGLDDLRQWTLKTAGKSIQETVHIYLDSETMESISRTFPYMVDTKQATGGGEVAAVQFHIIKKDENGVLPFTIDGIEIIPFEVEHGKFGNGDPYFALGFRVGDISYISDTNNLPQKSKDIISGSKIIVMDALRTKPHQSHFSFDQSYEACTQLLANGGRGYFTGLTHEKDHDDINDWIREQTVCNNTRIECAYDGMRVLLEEK